MESEGGTPVQLGTDLDFPGMVEDHQTQQDDCGEADEAFECKRVQGLLDRERANSRMMLRRVGGSPLTLIPGHFTQKVTLLPLLFRPGLRVRGVSTSQFVRPGFMGV